MFPQMAVNLSILLVQCLIALTSSFFASLVSLLNFGLCIDTHLSCSPKKTRTFVPPHVLLDSPVQFYHLEVAKISIFFLALHP